MALQIQGPYVRVADSNGNPYVGAVLYVYLPGTTTLASIYSDDGLSVALSNPLSGVNASNAKGEFPRAYIAAGTYKLRCETSAGVLIFEEDKIDTGLSAGTGALPISGGGTGGTTATAARTNLDVPSNSELSVLASQITTLQTLLQGLTTIPQGRLTLTSGTPVITSGVASATLVYYTPYIGNVVPIYDGAAFNAVTFSELTLTLNANHVASSIYDVFLFKDNGTLTIGTGPAWNTVTAGSCAVGTGAGTSEVTRSVGGLQTNAFSMTARNGATLYTVPANQGLYVGSLFMDTSNGQVTCHTAWGQSRKWGVWNNYNRLPILLKAGDATASWSYASATQRGSNGSTANTITTFQGRAEEYYDQSFKQVVITNGSTRSAAIAIGINSFTTASGLSTTFSDSAGSVEGILIAEYIRPANIGIDNVSCIEAAPAAASVTFLGTENNMVLMARWRG